MGRAGSGCGGNNGLVDNSPALLTDQYELTMLQAALEDGSAHRKCVFEMFARRLPNGRRYGVVCGVGRFLDALERFRFTSDQLQFLTANNIVNDQTASWLENYRFSGNIDGYREGETYFPDSPILTVEATFGEAVVLETLALSIYNFDSSVASAAARMKLAAGSRSCNEMGSRRAHEYGAVAAARAAYIAGFDATSNLQAGATYSIPTMGTSAHAFTLLHDTEDEAFASQVRSLGKNTTLLVDTFDVKSAVESAVRIAGADLGAVRIDSGDLVARAHIVRDQLNSLGAHDTKIVVTSDLDEHAIAALASAPVDAYGVGTSLVTGSGHPTAGLVYKLVARQDGSGEMQPVAKKSENKATRGGRKQAFRKFNDSGIATAELVTTSQAQLPDTNARVGLSVPLVRNGTRVNSDTIGDARTHLRNALAQLPADAHRLAPGDPAFPTNYEQ